MANGFEPAITALAYKSGMTDSVVTSYDADYTNGIRCGGGAMMMGTMSMPTMVTTTTFSVWDGDWAILEEYDSMGARIQGYVQGYHGLVKTLVDNVYYYQDEVGSTSHIATSTGALIESYQYDVYGKPRVYDSAGNYQIGATPRAQFLQGGARWMTEIGLYDDRNRFMSPDLGRFLQPDPIGFKGDASNLYRYCGNDWANRVDPMGTDDHALGTHYQELGDKNIQNAKDESDALPGSMMWDFEKRADTSGGNGTRDGRAQGKDSEPKDANPATKSANSNTGQRVLGFDAPKPNYAALGFNPQDALAPHPVPALYVGIDGSLIPGVGLASRGTGSYLDGAGVGRFTNKMDAGAGWDNGVTVKMGINFTGPISGRFTNINVNPPGIAISVHLTPKPGGRQQLAGFSAGLSWGPPGASITQTRTNLHGFFWPFNSDPSGK